MPGAPEVVVVGSIHMDLMARAARVPHPGESLLGTDFAVHPGGKAGNQAVAAAQQGARTAIVARVGDDPLGHQLRAALRRKGVDVSLLQMAEGFATGTSPVLMGENGEYASIIVPGASRELTPELLEPATNAIRGCRVLMLQFEIGLETSLAAAHTAAAGGGMVLLNASPPSSNHRLISQFWPHVDVVIVNRVEAESLSEELDDVSPESAEIAHRLKRRLGVCALVMTTGSAGVVLVDGDGPFHVPGHSVSVIDTIGAGDTFAGAVAAALARGLDFRAAVRVGNAAGALAVGRRGAHDAAPTLAETAAIMADPPPRSDPRPVS